MKAWLWSLCGAWMAVSSLSVAAPPTDAAATADALFQEARALIAHGDLVAACPKLEESQRIDPSTGTLLNLAECYERLGRTASAWVTFNDAAAMAIRMAQTERADFAKRRAVALEPVLPRLAIRVGAPEPGLHVERDGVVLGPAAWGSSFPVDPGPHEIVARARGYRSWVTRVAAPAGVVTTVTVPALDLEPAPHEPRANGTAPAKTTGVVLAVAGGVAVLTGLGLGLVAMQKNDEANERECSELDCTKRGAALLGEASTFAAASTIVTIAGAAIATAGVTLWILGSGPRARVSGSRVVVEGHF